MPQNEGILCFNRLSTVSHRPVSWCSMVFREESSSIIHKLTCMDSRTWSRIRVDLEANNHQLGEKQA